VNFGAGSGSTARTLSSEHRARLKERALNSDLCAKLGFHSIEKVRQGQTVPSKAIAFDYVVKGEVWNTKHRFGKGDMPWEYPGKALRLWNVDSLIPEPAPDEMVIITEGEFDGAACIQSGLVRVVSVPNGAPSSQSEQGDRRYSYLFKSNGRELIPDLVKFNRYVIATDGDEKGRWLRDELAVRLGDEKCSWVEWPSGCKDANDVLKAHGDRELHGAVWSARKMWNDVLGNIDDFIDREATSYRIGIPDIMFKVELPTFLVMMGPYHCGKSTFLRQMLWSLWKAHGWPFLLTCLEEPVKPRIRDHFRALEIGRHPANFSWNGKTAEEEIARADEQIRKAAMFLTRPLDKLLDPSSFLNFAELAVRRDGVRVIALDPVNELDHNIVGNEAHYWANFILECKRLADAYRLLFIVSGHPPKDAYQKLTFGKLLKAIDMAGGASWGNKGDITLNFWMPEMNRDGEKNTRVTLMHHEKSKDHESMGQPALYELTHYPGINRFEVTGRGWDLWQSKKKGASE
jgi:twinkle protein